MDFNVGDLIGHLVSPFAGGSFTELLVNAREHRRQYRTFVVIYNIAMIIFKKQYRTQDTKSNKLTRSSGKN